MCGFLKTVRDSYRAEKIPIEEMPSIDLANKMRMISRFRRNDPDAPTASTPEEELKANVGYMEQTVKAAGLSPRSEKLLIELATEYLDNEAENKLSIFAIKLRLDKLTSRKQ